MDTPILIRFKKKEESSLSVISVAESAADILFVNDPLPRSKQFPTIFQQTHLRKGCSIGANATILGGLEIGQYALVGAGSVVTKSVPSNSLVVGNPARVVGWVNEKGERLQKEGEYLADNDGNKFKIEKNKLIKL